MNYRNSALGAIAVSEGLRRAKLIGRGLEHREDGRLVIHSDVLATKISSEMAPHIHTRQQTGDSSVSGKTEAEEVIYMK